MPARRRTDHKTQFDLQLERLNVDEPFRRLVGWGCDPAILEQHLLLIQSARTVNTWEKLIGVKRREFKTIKRRLINCAHDLEKIGKSYLGFAQLTELCWLNPEVATLWPRLPGLLREFALNLDLDRSQFSLQPRFRLASNYVIALLVRYVMKTLNHPRDPEVAALIAAFDQRPDLTAASHKDWRYDHDAQLKADNLAVLDFLLPSH